MSHKRRGHAYRKRAFTNIIVHTYDESGARCGGYMVASVIWGFNQTNEEPKKFYHTCLKCGHRKLDLEI